MTDASHAHLGLILLVVAIAILIACERLRRRRRDLISKAPIDDSWAHWVIGVGLVVVGVALIGVAVMKRMEAASWVKTPCRILQCQIVTDGAKESVRYNIDLAYEYQFSGQTYRSTTCDFSVGSSRYRWSCERIAARYKPGTEQVCFVNPAKPTDAVLSRGMVANDPLALIPIAVGAFMLVRFYRRASWLPAPAVCVEEPDGSVHLRSDQSPFRYLRYSVIALLVWAAMMWGAWGDMQDRGVRIANLIVPIGGVFVGLWILVNAWICFVRPRLEMTLSTDSVRLGESVGLAWRLHGDVSQLSRCSIVLEGIEWAQYYEQDTTSVREGTFYRACLLDSQARAEMRAGEVTIAIPAGTMHSFKSENNAILWKLTFHGEVPSSFGITYDYPLLVKPVALGGS